MRKQFSKILVCILLCTLTVGLMSCAFLEPKEKTFTKAGISITLTEQFVEQEYVTQTVAYVSQKAIVTALKEDGTQIPGYDVTEYAKLVCTANKLDESKVVTKSGYAEFTYEKEVSGKDYYYYARCFKNGTDFWLVQFACETHNVEELTPTFQKWASTVTFK